MRLCSGIRNRYRSTSDTSPFLWLSSGPPPRRSRAATPGLGLDYRFYLKSKNRNPAPDGVYIGLYIIHVGIRSDHNITWRALDLDVGTRLWGNTFGVQLTISLSSRHALRWTSSWRRPATPYTISTSAYEPTSMKKS